MFHRICTLPAKQEKIRPFSLQCQAELLHELSVMRADSRNRFTHPARPHEQAGFPPSTHVLRRPSFQRHSAFPDEQPVGCHLLPVLRHPSLQCHAALTDEQPLHLDEGAVPVAETVLLLKRELGDRDAAVGKQKDRIIPESVRSSGA